MNYYEIFTFGNRRVDFATRLIADRSFVLFGEDLKSEFDVNIQLDSCFPLFYPYFYYYDYSRDEIGVISLESKGVLWSKNIKISNCKYIGVNLPSGALMVQYGSKCYSFDVLIGERRARDQPEDILLNMGSLVVTHQNEKIHIVNERLDFYLHDKSDHYIAKLYGDLICIVCDQRGLLIVSICDMCVVRRIDAPLGARFSGFYVSDSKKLSVGVSYFDVSGQTEMWVYDNILSNNKLVSLLPCAGKYIFIDDGNVVAFAAGFSYLLHDGGFTEICSS